jgi:hypothetical protein
VFEHIISGELQLVLPCLGKTQLAAHVSDAHSLRRSWQPKTPMAAQDSDGSPRLLGCQLRKKNPQLAASIWPLEEPPISRRLKNLRLPTAEKIEAANCGKIEAANCGKRNWQPKTTHPPHPKEASVLKAYRTAPYACQ